MTESPRTRAPVSPRRGTALAIVAVASLIAFLPFASASAPAVPHPFSSYDTGQVQTVVPSAAPMVELVQDQNSAVYAMLSAAEVVELAPAVGGYHVIASATPTTATSFNGSRPAGATAPWALSLAAELPVISGGDGAGPLAPHAGMPAVGPAIGIAELRVAFAPGPSTSAGASLLVGWSVSDWPISNASDLLGVVLHFNAGGAPTFVGCQSSSVLATPGCAGSAITSSTVRWSSSAVGAEAEGSGGAVAALSWTPSATNGSHAPAVSGVATDSSGGVDVALAPPASGTASAGTVAFALSTPAKLAAPAPVRLGSGPAYLLAAALAAGAALGGLALYRDWDARVRRDL